MIRLVHLTFFLLFLFTGVIIAMLNYDFISTSIMLLLAMIFDPFDHSVPFENRSSWQKSVHIFHFLLLLLSLILAMLKAFDLL